MLRTLTRALRTAPRTRYSIQTTRALCIKTPDTEVEELQLQDNLLSEKASRANIRNAFTNRCIDSVRYEYFAQRAELEAESDAAFLFRSLTETAKQQAMGYMELLEEYGDADFGDTLQNLEVSAEGEKANSEGALREHGVVAGREELEGVEEYFEDMADAAEKAWGRLEMTASMYDVEGMEGDDAEGDDTEGDDVEVPKKAKH